MQFATLAQLTVLMGVASAAPRPEDTPLSFDDIILFGESGETSVIKESQYQEIKARGLLQPASAPLAVKARTNNNNKRCDESEEVQVLTDESFLNWDVAMSPVVSSSGGGVTVGVSSGYSIANSVQVTAGVSATIESVLGLTMSVSYSESWTTTEGSTISYTLPDNNYGLIVSQPMTHRVTGNYISGCTDSPTTTGFTSDTYTSQSYGNLEWVTGVIRLCNSTTYPVPYCIGTGSHS